MLRSKSLKVISFMLIIKNKNNFHKSSVIKIITLNNSQHLTLNYMSELFGLEKKLLVGRYFCMVNIVELKWGRGSKKILEPFSVAVMQLFRCCCNINCNTIKV